MALSIVQASVVALNSSTGTDSASFTWVADDLFVVVAVSAHTNASVNTPTATGLTFAANGSAASNASWGWAHKWTATAAGSGSDNISLTAIGGGGTNWGAVVYQFRGAGGIGDADTLIAGGGTTTISLTTTADSAVVFAAMDEQVGSPGVTLTPASPTPTERVDATATNITWIVGDWEGVGAATTNYGTTYNAGNYFGVAIEVLGPVVTREQEGFRFRDDDGNETGASWLEAQDTDATIPLDTNARLRVLVNATNDPATTQYQLEYTEDGDTAWRAIGVGLDGATPTVVGFGSAALSTNDPSVNLSSGSWTPAEDDIVVFFIASTTVLDLVVDGSLPTGWFGVLGSGVDVNTDAHGYCAIWHAVTAGEVGGGTTFTATNALAAAETGNVVGVAIRGAHPTTPVHKAQSALDSANTVTPGVLSALSGGNQPTEANCLVVRGISQDSTGTWTTPGSHTSVTSNNTNQTNAVFTRDTATSAGVDVAATNITPDAGDEYASITIAFLPAPGVPSIDVATSTQFADGDATTAQLTAPSGKTTSDFDAGVMVEGQALADTVDITDGDYTEIEWVFIVQDPAVDTDVFDFRVTANGTPLDTYTVTPSLTVGAADEGVEGAGVASFGGTFTAAGVPETFGVAAASFGGTFTANGIDRAVGVAAASFGGTFTASGTAETPAVEGEASASFGGTFTANGIDRAVGVAAASFGGTFTASGIDRAVGVATATFGGTFTASGDSEVFGVAEASFGFTATAAGDNATPPVEGEASASFGGTFVASGNPRTQGAALAAFGFTAAADGVDRAIGQASATFGGTLTALGVDRALGAATATFGGLLAAAGTRQVDGSATAAFGGTFICTGFAGTPPTPGQAVATFGGTLTAAGIDRAVGHAVASFGGAASSSGQVGRYGQATATFGFTTQSLGTPKHIVTGQAAATFGFTATVIIVTYRIRVVSAAGQRYTAAAGSRYTAQPIDAQHTSEAT